MLPDCASRSGYRLVMQVFFDESGHCDQPVVVFGGLVIEASFAPASANAWMETLKAENLAVISMKDAMSFTGSLFGWRHDEDRIARRDALLKRLAVCVIRDVKAFICTPVSQSDFAALPADERKKYKDPKYLGFQLCMAKALEECPDGEQMQVCYDNSQECAGEVLRLYQRMRKDDLEFKKKCRSITFGEDEDFALLQLADMYTYCVRENEARGKTTRGIILELLQVLEPGGYVNHSVKPPTLPGGNRGK